MGFLWPIINPLIIIAIFTLVFSQIMDIKISGAGVTSSYVFYLCTGLLPWIALEETIRNSTGSLIANSPTLKNSPVPPEVLILYPALSSILNLMIGLTILLILFFLFGYSLGIYLIFLPLVIILQQTFAFGISLITGNINVFFRDIAQITNISLMFTFWLTPIVYSPSILPNWAYSIINLNPLTHIIFLYRSLILHNTLSLTHGVIFLPLAVFLILGIGIFVHKRMRGSIHDEL